MVGFGIGSEFLEVLAGRSDPIAVLAIRSYEIK
jgi:hypothetical protein